MTELNLWELEVSGGSFQLLEPGTYSVKVEDAAFGVSSKGNPMFTIDFVTDDGVPLRYWQVLTYINSKTGAPTIHWDIPDMARAIDPKLFPEEPAKRKAALGSVDDWANKVVKGLINMSADVAVGIRQYIPKLDEEGNQPEPRDVNEITKVKWSPKKAKATKVSL